MSDLKQGETYYCSKLGKRVIFLWYDSGYVVVQDNLGDRYFMKEKDLEEITGNLDMSGDDILKREG